MSEHSYTPPDTDVETDEDDENELEIVPPRYPICVDIEEQRRAWAVKLMADPEFDGNDIVEHAETLVQYLKTGASKASKVANLRPVKTEKKPE